MTMELILRTEAYACYRVPVMFGNTNCYLLLDQSSKQAAIIDPGANPERVEECLKELEAQPVMIINTHGHWDHIGGNHALQQEYDLPILIHEADAGMLHDGELSVANYFHGDGNGGKATRFLKEGDIIELGANQIQVLHTPGHTPGGVCLVLGQLLISGDTLFKLSIGRSDLAGGDFEALQQSLARLATLDDDLIVLPGHGAESRLGYEKEHNPYMRG